MLQNILLYNQRPTRWQVKATAGVAASLFLIFLSAIPFRDIRLWELDSYIPVIESLLMLGDLITAVLLLSQASIMRSGAVMALGTAYFFSSLVIIPHALTFPDAFSRAGLLGAGVNTSAWLYIFWRFGLPAGAVAYALLKKHSDWPGTWLSPNKAIVVCLGGAMVLVVGFTVLATVGDPLLPRLLSDPLHWRPTAVLYCVLALLVLTFIAMGLIWRTFNSVLDLWLLLMLFTVTMELTMTGIILGRFYLGWYVERSLGLFSGLLVLMLLLTETHRLYRQNMLRASAREQERERQLLIRDATVASIAHELRQPLSAILLNAKTGQLKGIHDDDIACILNEIAEDCHRATEIIESTRSLFLKSSVNKQPSDINQLVRELLALIDRDLEGGGISVDLSLDELLPPVVVNRLQMQELFLNLFTNAIEAMSEHDGKANVMTITSGPSSEGLVISIQDTGPGITDTNMKQIFDAFYTTKKNGTGIGLTVCCSIVAAHGGLLQAVSGYAAGAAFEIHLPYDNSGSAEVGRFNALPSERHDSTGQAYRAAAQS